MLPTKEFEGINARWNPQGEAFHFWRLVRINKMTLESVQQYILMTEKQLRWLIKSSPPERAVIEAIYEQRVDTWKAFQFLCAHPEKAQEFKQAAMSQGAS